MTDDSRKFYIGRVLNPDSMQEQDQRILYDPDDLTTHGVVVGMTGSGKTGLCIDILEEAALQGIPALVVDPKGDLANLLLQFPELRPEDFEPWVDPTEVRRSGSTAGELAAETARTWREGLAEWDIEPSRIQKLLDSVEHCLYTPGSQAATPVDILGSLSKPPGSWADNVERFRDAISGTTTALLGLVGIETDPVQSREHILVASLLENAWQSGAEMDLTELIRQVQSPPIDRLGAFELEKFTPAEDRMEMAMALNNLLASPSFAAWSAGQELDIEAMLWDPDGHPRHNIFYLAHLPDSERMFFVTLLLTALEAWMRGQQGSKSLRALFYMDEVMGYLPPVMAPPSKAPFLRLLKQARAFGIGLLLATQNPVDLDYKALSNAGSWFIGKLQTAQDKGRLLDGLASADAGLGDARGELEELIGRLDKRAFLLHNVHEDGPQVFRTRWAMAYLRGPISQAQLADLPHGVKRGPNGALGRSRAAQTEAAQASATRPAVPRGLDEFFLPAGEGQDSAEPAVYRPNLLAHASVRFLDRKADINSVQDYVYLIEKVDKRGRIEWEEHRAEGFELDRLASGPAVQAAYRDLSEPFRDRQLMKSIRADLLDYLYHSARLIVPQNEELGLVGQPGVGRAAFKAQLEQAADEAFDAEAEELREKYRDKIDRLQKKIARETRELSEDQAELSGRRLEELATHAENLLGLFGGSRGRRRVTSSLTKRRLTSKARADLEESQAMLEEYQRDLQELQEEMESALAELEDRWDQIAEQVQELEISPYKKDIHLERFGVLWVPA